MSLLLDLLTQVQKVLPRQHGGTGNDRGWANDAIIGGYPNGTGATLTRGTLVQLSRYGTMAGTTAEDNRIKKTTDAYSQDVLGIVVGYLRTDSAPSGQFMDGDCLDGQMAAVCIAGRALVNVEGTVVVGQFAYAADTDGQALGGDSLVVGGMGTWESGGTGLQWMRFWGASATPGVKGAILVVLGDGVTALQAGTMVDVVIPFSLRLTDWILLSTVSGSVSVDIYKDTYANFPPTAIDSITETSPPTITSGIKAQGTVPGPVTVGGFPPAGGWNRDLVAGDILRFNVESAGGVYQVSLLLNYIRR
jgi:hypothetical protein